MSRLFHFAGCVDKGGSGAQNDFRFRLGWPTNAQVAELADALDSGSSDRKVVEVRILSWAPTTYGLLARANATNPLQPTAGLRIR